MDFKINLKIHFPVYFRPVFPSIFHKERSRKQGDHYDRIDGVTDAPLFRTEPVVSDVDRMTQSGIAESGSHKHGCDQKHDQADDPEFPFHNGLSSDRFPVNDRMPAQ